MPTCSQAKIITNLENDIHKQLNELAISDDKDGSHKRQKIIQNVLMERRHSLQDDMLTHNNMPKSLLDFLTISSGGGGGKKLQPNDDTKKSHPHHPHPQPRSIQQQIVIEESGAGDDADDFEKSIKPSICMPRLSEGDLVEPRRRRRDSVCRASFESATGANNNNSNSNVPFLPFIHCRSKSYSEFGEEEEATSNILVSNNNKMSSGAGEYAANDSCSFHRISQSNLSKLAQRIEAIEKYSYSIDMANRLAANKDSSKSDDDVKKQPMGVGGHGATLDSESCFIKQTKRRLALASIRPSRTFNKAMTEQEVSILKKYYYESMSLNGQNGKKSSKHLKHGHPANPNGGGDDDDATGGTGAASGLDANGLKSKSLCYHTHKITYASLEKLEDFLKRFNISVGSFEIDVDAFQESNVLKLTNRDAVSVGSGDQLIPALTLPSDVNDTLVALTCVKRDNEADEANLFRILNNNEKASQDAQMQSKANAIAISSSSSDVLQSDDDFKTENSTQRYAPSASVASSRFGLMKRLIKLVGSVVKPIEDKKVHPIGLEQSAFLNATNFMDERSDGWYEKLGSKSHHHSNSQHIGSAEGRKSVKQDSTSRSKQQQAHGKHSKEAAATASPSKIMWFSSAPESKPFSGMFECADTSIDHNVIMEEANEYLKLVDSFVVSLELLPRRVYLNTVYILDVWIVTLNDMKGKYHLIANGLTINGKHFHIRSYDEFMLAEYEQFMRHERKKRTSLPKVSARTTTTHHNQHHKRGSNRKLSTYKSKKRTSI